MSANVDLNLYNSKADKRVVDKSNSINLIYSTFGFIKEQTDIVHPTFIIHKQTGTGTWDDINYIYSEYFGRYYYVDRVRVGQGKILEFDCTCDVLMTYKDEILARSCVIARQETNFSQSSGIFYDNEYPVRSDRVIAKKTVGTVAVDYSYYLTVNGGGIYS